jgi:hypothetical protein
METTAAARASRKILVFGRIRFIEGPPVQAYRTAKTAADIVIFVGEYAYDIIWELADESLLET